MRRTIRVKDTMKDPESSKDLRRFGRWLAQHTQSSAAAATSGPRAWPPPPRCGPASKASRSNVHPKPETYLIGSDKDGPEMNIDEQRGQPTKVRGAGSAPSSQGKPTAETPGVNVLILQATHTMMERMANLELRVSQSESRNDARSDLGSAMLADPPVDPTEPDGSDL